MNDALNRVRFYTNLNEISVLVLTPHGFALPLLPSTNYVLTRKVM